MNPFRKQRGSTLIVALVMLVLLTLIAVSAINSTSTSVQMVGNAQVREEATAVAQQEIERVISSSNFATAPAATAISADINKDGTPDYTGQVEAAECTSSIALTNIQLNFLVPADQQCSSSDKKSSNTIIGESGVVATSPSWCYRQSWDIRANVADSLSGARTTVHQGVYLRVPAGTSCP